MRRSALALAMLLCLPGIGAQSSSHALAIESHAFGYGPEDWKGGLPGEALTDWNASLGGRLDVALRFDPARGEPDGTWRAEATLTDGNTTVPGLADASEAGRFDVRFDIDGQRALPDRPAVRALDPGTWTIRLEVYLPGMPDDTYVGAAEATIDAASLGAQAIVDSALDPLPGRPVPEGALPHINEIGPGPTVLMNAAATGGRTVLAVDAGEAGRPITWRIYSTGDTLLPSVGGLPGLPVVVPNPGGVAWSTQPPQTMQAGADGVARIGLSANATGAIVVAAYDAQAGGLAVFALGLGGIGTTFDAITAPAPGEEGVVEVALAVGAGAVAGELLATSLDGAEVLQRVPLLPGRGDGMLDARLDGAALRDAGAGYGLVAVLLDPDGDYAGHALFGRGVEITFDVPVLGTGHRADVQVSVRQVGSDGRPGVAAGLAMHGELRFDDQEAQVLDVPEGGVVTRTFTVTPGRAGAQQFVAVFDTGDLVHEARHGAKVLDSDAYEDQQRPWYDPGKYVPGPPVAVLLGAIALAAAARRKR